MVLVLDIVLILTVYRSMNIDSSLTKNSLLLLAGVISDIELEFVKQWNINLDSPTILYIKNTFYLNYDENDLIKYLQYKFLVNFPIQLTYLKKNRINFILLYYYYKVFNLQKEHKIFNDEQREVIRTSHGITIENAGPGTGKTTTACRKAFEYKNEGVIFISYSNSAVKEDKKRMYDYPFTSSLITSKKYLFSTIDKLAGFINGRISETYDHSIKTAESTIEQRGYIFNYKHIIIIFFSIIFSVLFYSSYIIYTF